MKDITRNDYLDFSGHFTVCAQCGYRFTRGENGFRINQTGDIVHEGCFIDYAEDNRQQFVERVDF